MLSLFPISFSVSRSIPMNFPRDSIAVSRMLLAALVQRVGFLTPLPVITQVSNADLSGAMGQASLGWMFRTINTHVGNMAGDCHIPTHMIVDRI